MPQGIGRGDGPSETYLFLLLALFFVFFGAAFFAGRFATGLRSCFTGL